MKTLLNLLFLFLFISTYAQQTVTITTGTNWTDVLVFRNTTPGQEHVANTNYSAYPRIMAAAWTNSGNPDYRRTLLKFDLTQIPSNVTIDSATLYFYSDPNVTSGSAWNGNSQLSGSNALYLEKITQNWNEGTVTWNNQPPSTTTDRVWVGPSISTTENLTIDIKNMVQDWVANPGLNYGVKMFLQTEVKYRARNYIGSDNANISLHPKLVITYSDDSDPIKNQMDMVFGNLDQSEINTGILTDYGLDLMENDQYDGVLRSDNYVDMITWRLLYASFMTSTINPASGLIHLNTINERLKTYWESYDLNDQTVDIAAMFTMYQSMKDDAVDENLLSISGGSLYDVPGRPESPYLTKYSFAAAPNLKFDTDGEVSFVIHSDLFINSSNKTVSNIQVDFGNGSGYQNVSFDTPVNISYSSVGSKTLRFKVQFTDATTYYSHSKFEVLAVSGGASARYTGDDSRAFVFPRTSDPANPESFPNPEAWQGSFSGATVTVEYGEPRNGSQVPTTPQLIRPLIVVEGYDPSKFSALGISNYGYQDFIRGLSGLGAFVDDAGIVRPFRDALEDDGYDLVFVDFSNGTDDIIRNAYLLENIIEWVNTHKITDGSMRHENVVWGQSMGGLVARYAISDMEKRHASNPGTYPVHEVRTLLTQDSPHRGANVPLGFQAMVNELADMKLTKAGLATYGLLGGIIGSFIELKDIIPPLDAAEKLLVEPATRQMLLVQDGTANTFLEDYRTMVTFSPSYTPSFELIALANGSECGVPQPFFQAGGEILYINADFYANRLILHTLDLLVFSNLSLINPDLGVVAGSAINALSPFFGKNWKTDCTVNASSNYGGNQVFYTKIRFQKKIFFIININVTLFEESRTAPSLVLPWDSAPGGFYDLSAAGGSIPGNPNINAFPLIEANLEIRLADGFNFVPTVSALDIQPDPIPRDALDHTYNNNLSINYPSSFNEFKTQEEYVDPTLGTLNNGSHLELQQNSATWLLEKINQTPSYLNCTTDCGPDDIEVSGPATICTNETYSLSTLPVNYTVTWTHSGNLTYVSGQNTLNYTVNLTGSTGTPWVQAQLNGPCGPLVFRKDLFRGAQGIDYSDLTINGPYEVCPNQWYVYQAVNDSEIPITSYNWILPYGWTILDQSDNPYYGEVTVQTSQNIDFVGIDLGITTICGGYQPDWYLGLEEPDGDACLYTISVYPNPATSTINVSSNNNKSDIERSDQPIRLEMYNSQQLKVLSMPFKYPSSQLDVSGFPPGYYVLHIISSEGIIRQSIFIENDD